MRARYKPDSKATAVRKAEKTLVALLRTPKTRSGLVAAVASHMITRRFVFGWLAEQTRNGQVVVLKSGKTLAYQNKGVTIAEAPDRGLFPAWLDPRVLPVSSASRTFVDGKQVVSPPAVKVPRIRKRRSK